MNKEQEYLIKLSAAYLHGEKIRLKEEINYPELIKESLRQDLFGVAFCAIADSANKNEVIDKAALARYQALFTESLYNSNLLMKVYGDLKAALTGAQIRFVPVKGVVLRNYYPVSETRSMGDADVLIDADNRNAAKAALIQAGFTCESDNGPEWAYRKNGIRMEVHTSILNASTGKNNAKQYFADAIDHANFSGFEGRFDDTYHFEFLLTHLAQHFCYYGAGIRMILDLAVMLKACDIDVERVLKDLDSAGLGKFAKTMLSVCWKWYGCGCDLGEETAKAEDFLASHGTFGFTNRNISAVVERKDLEVGKTGGTFLKRLRLLFPSYQRMKEIPYIKFIENRPYLTPFAWVYRFFYNLKHKKAFMMGAVKGLADKDSEKEAQKELEFFREIGLS